MKNEFVLGYSQKEKEVERFWKVHECTIKEFFDNYWLDGQSLLRFSFV